MRTEPNGNFGKARTSTCPQKHAKVPTTKDKVETTFNGELFQTFILRGTIKVDGKPKEATAFMSSAEEINARASAKGTDPGKYPIAYILYQDGLKKKED